MKTLLLLFAFSFLYSQEYQIVGSFKIYSNYSAKDEMFLEVDSTQINTKDFRIAYDTETLDVELSEEISFDVELTSGEIDQNRLYNANVFLNSRDKTQKNMVNHYDVALCCFRRKDIEDLENFEEKHKRLVFTFFESGIKPKIRIIIELKKTKEL